MVLNKILAHLSKYKFWQNRSSSISEIIRPDFTGTASDEEGYSAVPPPVLPPAPLDVKNAIGGKEPLEILSGRFNDLLNILSQHGLLHDVNNAAEISRGFALEYDHISMKKNDVATVESFSGNVQKDIIYKGNTDTFLFTLSKTEKASVNPVFLGTLMEAFFKTGGMVGVSGDITSLNGSAKHMQIRINGVPEKHELAETYQSFVALREWLSDKAAIVSRITEKLQELNNLTSAQAVTSVKWQLEIVSGKVDVCLHFKTRHSGLANFASEERKPGFLNVGAKQYSGNHLESPVSVKIKGKDISAFLATDNSKLISSSSAKPRSH